MKLSETHPHAYGMLATALGVLVFVPDALLLRLIGGDVLAMAFWRGILAGSVFLFWSYFVSGAPRMSVKQSISGPYCPSSYKMGHQSGLSFGGSVSSVGLIMQPAFDVASGDIGLSVS